jgi:hypothetical protein
MCGVISSLEAAREDVDTGLVTYQDEAVLAGWAAVHEYAASGASRGPYFLADFTS